jgi:uncharacterized membrane protein
VSRLAEPEFEHDMERIVGNLLRIGVMVATAVVLLGVAIYLARHGREPAAYHLFVGEPAALRGVAGILAEARSFHGRGLIQLGLLLLMATPVARVAFSVYAFARQRDGLYTVVTLVVLAVMLYSLSRD